MKNITLSADEQLIEQARLLAKSQHKTSMLSSVNGWNNSRHKAAGRRNSTH
jgi:hypothetical protein